MGSRRVRKARILMALSLTLLFILSFSVPVMADVTKIVGMGQDGKCYEYSYADLNQSYMNSLLGISGTELYNHFRTMKSTKAFYDSVRGYVDYNNIYNAYVDSLLNGSAWNTNTYISSSAALATMSATVEVVTISNGQIALVTTPIENGGEVAFEVISIE